MEYDIIGDVHGEAEALEALLAQLGYRMEQGAWRTTGRQAVFLGDFIDRGPRQLDTIDIVRRMIDAGSAMAIMGNHEFNAIGWFEGWRDREKGRDQHDAFLAEAGELSATHKALVEWFKELPLWLELDGINAIHACWHPSYIDWLRPQIGRGNLLSGDLLRNSFVKPESAEEIDTPEPSPYKAVDAVLKGLEAELPPGVHVMDHEGKARKRVRLRWWASSADNLRSAAMLEVGSNDSLPAEPIPEHKRLGYSGVKPLFFGHYWFAGTPAPVSSKAACLDYSVAKGGKLCAYRWRGETDLKSAHFVFVEGK